MPHRVLTNDSPAEDFASFALDIRARLEPGWYRTKYPDFDYRFAIYVDTSHGEWTDEIARIRTDYSGESEFMDVDSTDYPLVDVSLDAGKFGVHEVKMGFRLSRSEMIRASQIGMQLATEKMDALNLIFERDTCRRVLFGSKKMKHPGLFNWDTGDPATSIPVISATASLGKVIDDAAALTTPSYGPIIAYFNAIKKKVEFDQTNTVFTPSYFILPALAHNKLAATVFPGVEGNALSAVEAALKMKIYSHRFLDKEVFEHEDMDKLSKDRIVTGSKSKQVARFNLPMPKKLDLPEFRNGGLVYYQPAIQRVALTEVRIPKAFLYVDMPDYDYNAAAGLTK